MNEEIQKKMLDYLTGLEAIAKSTSDIAVEQIPQVLREMVWFEVAWSVVFSLTIVVWWVVFVKKGLPWLEKKIEDNKNNYTTLFDLDFARFVLLIVSAFLIIPFLFNVHDGLKASLAPRVFLIEKISSLAKK